MKKCDVLLMPYQKNVSVGNNLHNTVEWMSPMKMFEYMSSRVPVISSKLPVLSEILIPNINCLMASPDKIVEWQTCLKKLYDNKSLRARLSFSAYRKYRDGHTWKKRASAIYNYYSK